MTKPFHYGECDRCGGTVAEKIVQQVCSRKGRAVVIVDDVPAGVCQQCGGGSQISLPLFQYAA